MFLHTHVQTYIHELACIHTYIHELTYLHSLYGKRWQVQSCGVVFLRQPFFAFLRLLRGRCRRKRLRQRGRRRPAAAGEKLKKSFELSPGVSSLHGLDVRPLPIVLTLAKIISYKILFGTAIFKTKKRPENYKNGRLR